jgi:hypothetical protein
MTLPSRENLKPQLPKENFSPDQGLENLKSSLRMAYKLAAKVNRKSHYNKKDFTIAKRNGASFK